MTDAEQMRQELAELWGVIRQAADRIEAMIAEREKDHANINLKADFIDKTINQLAETHAKLAQAVKALEYYALEDVSAGFYDSLVARTALAEIKGETK